MEKQISQEEKRLEVIVDGKNIGNITMKVNGSTTIVEGQGIIPTGTYSLECEEIKNMVLRRLMRDYQGREIKANYID